MKSGARPNAVTKALSWVAISMAMRSRDSSRKVPRISISDNGRNDPRRVGRKPGLSGVNGAVKVTCRPMAKRREPALSIFSDAVSAGWKDGATTITEVALMRPFTRRSRIALSTASEMP
jgi:hypothetical protein